MARFIQLPVYIFYVHYGDFSGKGIINRYISRPSWMKVIIIPVLDR